MIRLEDIRVERNGKTLLDDVSISFEKGLMTAVIGPNGAGKSSLLRVMSGDMASTRGLVEWAGRKLEQWPLMALARVRAVVSQLSGLDFPLSVREVVALGRYPHQDRHTPTGIHAIQSALQVLELADIAESSYTSLSGGERQRVQVARALCQVSHSTSEERWLLLDEPTSALDLVHQHRLMEVATAFKAGGGGVFAIVHDPNLAARYADYVVILSKGYVVARGPTRDVLTSEVLTSLYGVKIEVTRPEGWDYDLIITSPPTR